MMWWTTMRWVCAGTLLLILFMGGCAEDRSTPGLPLTGSLIARAVWPEQPTQPQVISGGGIRPLAPAGVVVMRAVVTGDGMTDMVRDFQTGTYPTGATIDRILAGDNRVLTLFGLDGSDVVIYHGASTPVQLAAGEVKDLGTITMASTWAAISSGDTHVLALRHDGTLWAWGYNWAGQLGLGDNNARAQPEQVGGDTDWVQISANRWQSFALKSNGRLYAWGHNMYGQLGIGGVADQTAPTLVDGASDWAGVSAGAAHTLAVKTGGTLWAWGSNDTSELGTTSSDSCPAGTFPVDCSQTPLSVDGATDWESVAAGSASSFALKSNDTLFAWGSNTGDFLGTGTSGTLTVPTEVLGRNGVDPDSDWASIVSNDGSQLALKTDNTLWAWGKNTYGELGLNDVAPRTAPVQVGTAATWSAVSLGRDTTVGLRSDGSYWTWGRNGYGQYGNGTLNQSLIPVKVGSETEWSHAAAGTDFTVIARLDGSLWSAGKNSYGQLGIAVVSDQLSPVQVAPGTTWLAIAAGLNHAVAVRADGTLWSWGENGDGQLGHGDAQRRQLPEQVGTDNAWSAVAAGDNFTVALKNNGWIYTWGNNDYGQLGTLSGNDLAPTRVCLTPDIFAPQICGEFMADVGKISAGTAHTMALMTDFTLWSWGWNNRGRLGHGDTTDVVYPKQIGLDTDWVDVSAGGTFTVAIKGAGNDVWGWGFNAYGQVGDGTYYNAWELPTPGGRNQVVERLSPTQTCLTYDVPTETCTTPLSGVVALVTGWNHTVAKLSNNTLLAWGTDDYGESGNGTTFECSLNIPFITSCGPLPLAVGADNTWTTIAAGKSHSLGTKGSGTRWGWGRNTFGQVGDGSALDRSTPVEADATAVWDVMEGGDGFSLGLKQDGSLWSWGSNGSGQLGQDSLWRQNLVQVVLP